MKKHCFTTYIKWIYSYKSNILSFILHLYSFGTLLKISLLVKLSSLLVLHLLCLGSFELLLEVVGEIGVRFGMALLGPMWDFWVGWGFTQITLLSLETANLFLLRNMQNQWFLTSDFHFSEKPKLSILDYVYFSKLETWQLILFFRKASNLVYSFENWIACEIYDWFPLFFPIFDDNVAVFIPTLSPNLEPFCFSHLFVLMMLYSLA